MFCKTLLPEIWAKMLSAHQIAVFLKERNLQNKSSLFKLLMIPEIVIMLNQISACVAYKSVAYKRHVMLF